MDDKQNLIIRMLGENDPPVIAAAYAQIGWNKPEAQYRQYLGEQSTGTRACSVAVVVGQFAGYVTVNWRPSYPGFAEQKIPEIQDLNVLPKFQRQGIASRLLEHAESQVAPHSSIIGIGVGFHPGYNVAQRLYVKRGYIPDGHGVTYRNRYMQEGESIVLDDEFLLHFTKRLKEE